MGCYREPEIRRFLRDLMAHKDRVPVLICLCFLSCAAVLIYFAPESVSLVPKEARPISAKAVWRIDTQPMSAGEEIATLAVCPNGSLVALGTFEGKVNVWQTADTSHRTTWKAHDAKVSALCYFPDSRHLVTAGGD